ncbi:hypothetical protein L0F63_003554, partial [Massospora cicadina]
WESELVEAFGQSGDRAGFTLTRDFEDYCAELALAVYLGSDVSEGLIVEHLHFLSEILGLGSVDGGNGDLAEFRGLVGERVVWDVIPTVVELLGDGDKVLCSRAKAFIQALACSSLSPKELHVLVLQQVSILVKGCRSSSQNSAKNELRLDWGSFLLGLLTEFGFPRLGAVAVQTKFYESLILGFRGWFGHLKGCQMALNLFRQPPVGLETLFKQAILVGDLAARRNVSLGLQFLLELLCLALQDEGPELDFASHEFDIKNPRYRTATAHPEQRAPNPWHGFLEISRLIASLDAGLVAARRLLSEPVYDSTFETRLQGILVHLYCSDPSLLADGSLVPSLTLMAKPPLRNPTLDLLCWFQLRGPDPLPVSLKQLLPLWANFVVGCDHERLRFIAYNCLSRISTLIPPADRFPLLATLSSQYQHTLQIGGSDVPPGALAMVLRLIQEGLIQDGFGYLEGIWPTLLRLQPTHSGLACGKRFRNRIFHHPPLPLFAQLVAFYLLVEGRIPDAPFKTSFVRCSVDNLLVPLRSYLEVIKSLEGLQVHHEVLNQLTCQLDMALSSN